MAIISITSKVLLSDVMGGEIIIPGREYAYSVGPEAGINFIEEIDGVERPKQDASPLPAANEGDIVFNSPRVFVESTGPSVVLSLNLIYGR